MRLLDHHDRCMIVGDDVAEAVCGAPLEQPQPPCASRRPPRWAAGGALLMVKITNGHILFVPAAAAYGQLPLLWRDCAPNGIVSRQVGRRHFLPLPPAGAGHTHGRQVAGCAMLLSSLPAHHIQAGLSRAFYMVELDVHSAAGPLRRCWMRTASGWLRGRPHTPRRRRRCEGSPLRV